MRTLLKSIGITVVIMMLCVCFSSKESHAQTAEQEMKRQMTFIAEVVKVRDNYFLRAEKPSEVFTILNPDPKILDGFIDRGETARMEVRIVSGDNVNIETINGKKYFPVEP